MITFVNHAIGIPVELVAHVAQFLTWNEQLGLRLINKLDWLDWYQSQGFYDLVVERLILQPITEEGRTIDAPDRRLPSQSKSQKDSSGVQEPQGCLRSDLATISTSVVAVRNPDPTALATNKSAPPPPLKVLVAVSLDQAVEERVVRAVHYLRDPTPTATKSSDHYVTTDEAKDLLLLSPEGVATYCLNALLSTYDLVFLRRTGGGFLTLLEDEVATRRECNYLQRNNKNDDNDDDTKSFHNSNRDFHIVSVFHDSGEDQYSIEHPWTAVYGVLARTQGVPFTKTLDMHSSQCVKKEVVVSQEELIGFYGEILREAQSGPIAEHRRLTRDQILEGFPQKELFPSVHFGMPSTNERNALRDYEETEVVRCCEKQNGRESNFLVCWKTTAACFTVVNPPRFEICAFGYFEMISRVELVDLLQLEVLHTGCFYRCRNVENVIIINAPNLRQIFGGFCNMAPQLKRVVIREVPQLCRIGRHFCYKATSLESVTILGAPRLQTIQPGFCHGAGVQENHNNYINSRNVRNRKKIGGQFNKESLSGESVSSSSLVVRTDRRFIGPSKHVKHFHPNAVSALRVPFGTKDVIKHPWLAEGFVGHRIV